MKYYITILLFVFTTSCLVQFTGTTNDFKLLNEDQKAKIEILENFSDLENNKVYELTGPKLLFELQKHEKSIVYIFANKCNSDYCISLKSIEDYANKNSLKLFLVMNSYNNLNISIEQNVKTPLFAIDDDYYKTEKRRQYVALFQKDLGYEFSKENWGNYYFFEKDKLVEVKRTVQE